MITHRAVIEAKQKEQEKKDLILSFAWKSCRRNTFCGDHLTAEPAFIEGGDRLRRRDVIRVLQINQSLKKKKKKDSLC